MRNASRIRPVVVLLAALLGSVLPTLAGGPAQATVSSAGWTRLAGADRYATAVAVSQAAFPDGSGAAVVASGEDFPDGLTAAYLAGQVGGPVLLTRKRSVPAATLEELARLGAGEVYVIGGGNAVSSGVVQRLGALSTHGSPVNVVRVWGRDRYGTAAQVAQSRPAEDAGRVGGDRVAILASGVTFADALAGSAAAAGGRLPLLLTAPGSLPATTRAALELLGIDRVWVLGGPAAVSESVIGELRGAGVAATRIAGADRVATAAALADREIAELGFGSAGAVLVRGDDTGGGVDALSAGVLAGTRRVPLLLAQSPDVLGSALTTWLSNTPTAQGGSAVGGPAALTQGLLERLTELATPPPAPPAASPPAAVSDLLMANRFQRLLHLTWSNPSGTARIVVRRAEGARPPASPSDGTAVPLAAPNAEDVVDDNLQPATTYSYAVFTRDSAGRYSRGATVTGTTRDKSDTGGPIPASTTVLDAADLLTVQDPSADGTQVNVALAATVKPPTAGDHLVIPPTSDFPDGMLAEVQSATTHQDGTTAVRIRQTSLDQALPNTLIDQDTDFTMEPVSTTTTDGLARMTATAHTALLAVSPKVFDCKNDQGTSLDPADLFDSPNPLPISIEFSNYHWLQRFDPGSFFPRRSPYLLLQLSGEADVSAELRAKTPGFSCELSPTWRRQHRLFRARIGTVPGTPLPVTINLEMGLKFEVSGEAGLTFTQHRYWGVTVHKYADDPMVTAQTSGSANPATATVSSKVSADADLFADVSVMAGGGYKTANAQAGVYGTLGPFLSVEAAPGSDSLLCVSAAVGFKTHVGVRLKLWVKRWNLEVGDVTWAKKSVFDSCDPPNPDAGNGPTGGDGGDAAPPPVISTTSLPEGTVGTPYTTKLSTVDTRPGTWTLTAGALPEGLALDGNTGAMTGTPASATTSSSLSRSQIPTLRALPTRSLWLFSPPLTRWGAPPKSLTQISRIWPEGGCSVQGGCSTSWEVWQLTGRTASGRLCWV